MKHYFTYINICTLFLLLNGCDNSLSQQNVEKSITEKKDEFSDTSLLEIEPLIEESKNYLQNRDFDGDKINDYLSFIYSGGAHCCYKMTLKLSSIRDTIKYPFEMDGGYGFGIVDGSVHDQFDIDDYDQDGLPEIFMGISTYNQEIYSIDPEWTSKYGIKTNYIIFNYSDGEIILEDYDTKKHITKNKHH